MYRGLLIDTGRNFIPLKNLRKMVDAMAFNKLNMFHWHLSDSNSFPFASKRVPQVTAYGTYSSKKVYTPTDVLEFVQYANLRGVKVIPELDAPSHAGKLLRSSSNE
jgi:hexosaminidase